MKLAALAVVALAGSAMAQTLDGSRDGSYTNLFSQNVQTGFGDNYSELDNFSWSSDGTNLYIFAGGNIQDVSNRMTFFFSTTNPGQSTLSGIGGGNFNNLQLTFDAGFGGASRWVNFNNYQGTIYGNVGAFDGSSWTEEYIGNSSVGGNVYNPNGSTGISGFLNNSNTAGVTGGNGATENTAVSGAVSTGLEICIPLSWLGYTGGQIRVAGFINGGSNDYASNQFIGGFQSSQGNLGGDGNGNWIGGPVSFDLNDFDGDQFVTIVPTPGAAGLLGLGALAMGRRRR